jgi:hypothetical protein
MKIIVDIDNTICDTETMDYKNAKPFYDRIDKINKLFNDGNEIIYWTARGTKTGINWFHITYQQLEQWGCKFHELRMNKPIYDLFIDDKNINSDDFFSK